MYDLVSLGLLTVDTLAGPVTPKLFEQDSMHVSIKSMPGGDACNVCINGAALGLSCALVTCAGEDAYGEYLKEELRRAGVDTKGVSLLCGKDSAQSLVLTEPSGERHFLTSTDIFGEISTEQVTEGFLPAKYLTLNSYFRMPRAEGEPLKNLFGRAHDRGVLTGMDTMVCRQGDPMEKIRPALTETDYFLPSFDEAAQIAGTRDIRQIRKTFSGLGPKVLAVKMGSEGAFVSDFSKDWFIPAVHLEGRLSSVGAGDAFFACFLAAQSFGMSLSESAVFATCGAAVTVKAPGATGGIRSKEQVMELYGKYMEEHGSRYDF